MAELYQVRNGKPVPISVAGGDSTQIMERIESLETRVDEIEGTGGTGIVISDAVDSESSETAASSKAVKTAYDTAVLAREQAEQACSANADARLLEQCVALGDVSGSVTLDLEQGRIFSATAIGAVTLTVSADQPGVTILLHIAGANEYVLSWGMNPKWDSGIAPTLGSNDLIALHCGPDSSWYGVHVSGNAAGA